MREPRGHADDAPDITTVSEIRSGATILGIELGSTRIKARVIDSDHQTIASGTFEWASELIEGTWTYDLAEVWSGLQACYAALVTDVERRYGVVPVSYAAIGVSGMMHGYLAFGAEDNLLTPFRTWRNTSAEVASRELTSVLGHQVPRRWSVSHLYQAIIDSEAHVHDLCFLTTLAGYVHWRLTGQKVLGVGDASGMFPIDPRTRAWDAGALADFDRLVSSRHPQMRLDRLLPRPLAAGETAGDLTPEGAEMLDPTGALQPGIPFCPPEGDAGTGMVATNSVRARTGNVSVGTSIFAMVVLERPFSKLTREIDLVVTPAGDPVAMVHCNNGANELAQWATVFGRFAEVIGHEISHDDVYSALFKEALTGRSDGGGVVAYNFAAGEPIAGVFEGRPLILRTPERDLTLADFVRAQIYSVFATLSIGFEALADDGATVEMLYAHGGIFKTEGVAQRLLAAAVGHEVAVSNTAAEGGSWGIAALAAYRVAVLGGSSASLAEYLEGRIFSRSDARRIAPDPEDRAGFQRFLDRYRAALPLERAAANATSID